MLRFELSVSALIPKAGLNLRSAQQEALSSSGSKENKKSCSHYSYRILVRVLRFELKAS